MRLTEMLRKIDDVLNRFTMYRIVLYGLGALFIIAFTFSLYGVLDFEPISMIVSLVVITITGLVVNRVLGWVWNVPVNTESGIITCFILFFLVSPSTSSSELFMASLVAIIAFASKFLITYHGQHIYNPAAFGLVVVGVIGLGHASWWVGSSVLWPFVLALGLIIARKMRRTTMVLLFWGASLAAGVIFAVVNGVSVAAQIELLVISSPLIFLGSIMLTEPSTTPPRRRQQYIVAVTTAMLFVWHPGSGALFVYPDTALIITNTLAFVWSPKNRFTLTFVRRRKYGIDGYDYEFKPNKPLRYMPGQYMEYTLPLSPFHTAGRGNRRIFTTASAPTEATVHVGVRIPEMPSKFKQALDHMSVGDKIFAGQIAGDFTLPKDTSRKIVGIAGGIGITPFRSMVKSMIDSRQSRDMILVYLARSKKDFMYADIFTDASKYGLKIVYISEEKAFTAEWLLAEVPDILSRAVYVSGPPAMTRTMKDLLCSVGIKRSAIKTDYFAGY